MLTHDHGYMQMWICACMHLSIYAWEGCVHACAYVHMSYHLHFCMYTCGYNGMRMCVWVHVCIYVCTYMSIFGYIHLYMSKYMCICICVLISPCVLYVFAHVPIHLWVWVCLHVCMIIWITLCEPICISMCESVFACFLWVCLHLCLHVYACELYCSFICLHMCWPMQIASHLNLTAAGTIVTPTLQRRKLRSSEWMKHADLSIRHVHLQSTWGAVQAWLSLTSGMPVTLMFCQSGFGVLWDAPTPYHVLRNFLAACPLLGSYHESPTKRLLL